MPDLAHLLRHDDCPRRLGRLANRLTKMVCEAHTLETAEK
jgi:hypothetical protein